MLYTEEIRGDYILRGDKRKPDRFLYLLDYCLPTTEGAAMSNNVKLLLIFLFISVGSNLYQLREVVNLQDTIRITTAYYQSELARLYDFHLDCIADLNSYYRGK